MRFLKLQGKTWAVGLRWSHGGSGKRKFSALQSEAMALDPELNFVALRRLQHGFAKCHPEGVKDALKAYALAASLRITATSFLGLFRLKSERGRDFWWVVALRDGRISGQGDNVFNEREEAEAHVTSLRDLLGDFDQNVVCESETESNAWLASVLLSWGFMSRFSGNPRLRLLHEPASKKRSRLLLIAGGIAGLGLAWFAIDSFLEYQGNLRIEALQRLALRDKEDRKRELLANPERHFEQGWLKAPQVADFAGRCIRPMLRLPTFASGWKMDAAVCDGKNVSVTWAHNLHGDYVAGPDNARLESTTKSVSRIPLGADLKARPKEKLETRDSITRQFYQITQYVGMRLNLKIDPPEKKEIEEVQITAPWMRGTWELADIPASCIMDAKFAQILSLPGVTLQNVSFNRNVWTFKGNVYVK